MSGHTPGPWYALGKSILLERPGLAMLDTIARCVSSRSRRKAEAEANALLIAAAPDLLKALKQCEHTPWCDSWNGGPGCDCPVPAAIAKAEGR